MMDDTRCDAIRLALREEYGLGCYDVGLHARYPGAFLIVAVRESSLVGR